MSIVFEIWLKFTASLTTVKIKSSILFVLYCLS